MTVALPKELQSGLNWLESCEAERETLAAHLLEVAREITKHSSDSDSALVELADIEASATVSGTAGASAKLKARVRDTLDRITLLEARQRGLVLRKKDSDEKCVEARRQLTVTLTTWSQATRAACKARIVARANSFVSDIAEDLAVCRALADSSTLAMKKSPSRCPGECGEPLAALGAGHRIWRLPTGACRKAQPRIVRLPHFAHPAPAKHPDNFVVAEFIAG